VAGGEEVLVVGIHAVDSCCFYKQGGHLSKAGEGGSHGKDGKARGKPTIERATVQFPLIQSSLSLSLSLSHTHTHTHTKNSFSGGLGGVAHEAGWKAEEKPQF
jgi:hypothetical protein